MVGMEETTACKSAHQTEDVERKDGNANDAKEVEKKGMGGKKEKGEISGEKMKGGGGEKGTGTIDAGGATAGGIYKMTKLARKKKKLKNRHKPGEMERKTGTSGAKKTNLEITARKILKLRKMLEKVELEKKEVEQREVEVRKWLGQRQMELDRLAKAWKESREKLAEEQKRNIELEAEMRERNGTSEERILMLSQQIALLRLDLSKLRVDNGTQTMPLIDKSINSNGMEAGAHVGTQTEMNWSEEYAAEMMRAGKDDEQLCALIAGLEQQRAKSEADCRLALAQKEQQLREQYDAELHNLCEEKQRQIEEMEKEMRREMLQMEEEKHKLEEGAEKRNRELKMELFELRHKFALLNEEHEASFERQRAYENAIAKCDQQLFELTERNIELNGQLQVGKIDSRKLKEVRDRLRETQKFLEGSVGDLRQIERLRYVPMERLAVIRQGMQSNLEMLTNLYL